MRSHSSSIILWKRTGSIPGAALGGLAVEPVEEFVDACADQDAVAFGILFIMLLVRAARFLGRRFI